MYNCTFRVLVVGGGAVVKYVAFSFQSVSERTVTQSINELELNILPGDLSPPWT